MRLKHIKLAGFKSFVDPTTVPFPSNLAAVVGPNGCGKSNIIDAVRWVMGESSAKQLRGESLDDVIFNGSTLRKPVGQASIELSFDNSDGSLTGQYASYAEIAVRREITRDGQSSYYLNGARCRRRDITDLFLGTGLGPRSYAIIEQGMITRLIDAKPEELRGYLEEAAGISKYKERRHETELRMQHTNENLARLNDIREELSKQINHLQRQANAAERYKVLKQEERLLRAQILALRWRNLDQQLQAQNQHIEQQQTLLTDAIAAQQQIEQILEQQRAVQSTATNENNEIQARYYQLESECARLAQTIQHHQERHQQWQQEQADLLQNHTTTQQQLSDTEQHSQELSSEVTRITPQVQTSQQAAQQSQAELIAAEQALQQWQQQWEEFNRETAQAEQRTQVEQTRIQHLQQHLQTIQQRMARLHTEREQQALELVNTHQDALDQEQQDLLAQQAIIETSLQNLVHELTTQRQQNQQSAATLDNSKHQLQALYGQQASLEALQQAALGQQEKTIIAWLQQQGLTDKQRLAQVLQVEPGWEPAVETVLEKYLQAVCVNDIKALDLQQLPSGNLSLVECTAPNSTATNNSDNTGNTAPNNGDADNTGLRSHSEKLIPLLDKVQAPYALLPLLAGIYCTGNVNDALALTNTLAPHESIITPEGVWLGNNWLTITQKTDAQSGVLQRERELNTVKKSLADIATQVQQQQEILVAGQNQLQQLEEQREQQQRQLAAVNAAQTELRAQQQVRQARLLQAQQRTQQIDLELQECAQLVDSDQQAAEQAQRACDQARSTLNEQHQQREQLLQAKASHQATLDNARLHAQQDQQQAHQLALQLQAAEFQFSTSQQQQTRLQQQLQQLRERQSFLQQTIADNHTPITALTQELQAVTEQRNSAEATLNSVRQQAEQLEHTLQQLEKQRQEAEQTVANARTALEQVRLSGQALQVRTNTLQEQLSESDHDLASLLTDLPAEAIETTCEEQLAQLTRKIERLGPINLAAIDEYATQNERKTYLDTQYNDLTDALQTLTDAIQKIDRETRTRFKETYEGVNAHFQTLFPRLFGGGRASLELNENDLLTTGITVMAQPPGKRNSTINLLSGGEKTLTAIALVFSFFQLNPAPFCMLDEVDAPLDDANIVRFCNLVKEMASKVQFIFISHNKLAIEMAQHLAGVTMHEAGVSRLVAVDIEEAIALAAA